MKLALIPPLSLIEYTFRTNYQLVVPAMFISPSYVSTYQRHCGQEDQFVILDNGAPEGELCSTDKLVDVATRWRVDELVIPDVLGDAEGTIKKAQEFHDDVVPPRGMNFLRFGLMFVVQGQTLDEVLKTAAWANSQYWIDSVGIPRHLVTTMDDMFARVRVANIMQGHGWKKQIHFLGANSLFAAEVNFLSNPEITTQDYVRGMDTSMPFNYAYHGKTVVSPSPVARPEKYFHEPLDKFDKECTEFNVNHFIKAARANGVEKS